MKQASKSNKSLHTPGPWRLTRETVRTSIVRDSGGKALLYVPGELEPRTDDRLMEYEANARLIAAAPEMLTALEKLIMQIEDQGLQDRFTLGLSHAERALAKARGEE